MENLEVNNAPVEINNQPDEGTEENVESSPEMQEALHKVNDAVIETGVKTISNIAVLITKIPELEFTDDEIDQLKTLWSSQIPTMSPMTGAIIGTTLIVAVKVAIYMKYKDRASRDKTVKDYVKSTEEIKEATEKHREEQSGNTENTSGN